MKKLLFVINPISGGIDKNGLRKMITKTCESHSQDYSFFDTTGKDDVTKLKHFITELKPTAVIACGGDGTVNLVAESIYDKELILGIIPMGSANGLATELNIPDNVETAIRLVLEGNALPIDILWINKKHMCLHLADVGLNAKLIRRFEKQPGRGKLGYARNLFETLFNSDAIKYQFETETECFEEKAEMVVFANARKYGTGAIVNPEGKINDGNFEVCIFKPYPWYAIIKLTYMFFTGKLKRSPFVKIFSTPFIKVSSEMPEDLQIDGESHGKSKTFTVEVGKHQLPIIVNKKEHRHRQKKEASN